MDVILVNAPNKNIDYPGLSLPVLTSALRHNGIRTKQIDYNVILRDKLLTRDCLVDLHANVLPYLVEVYSESEFHLANISELYSFLTRLSGSPGFDNLEKVKLLAQRRDFAEIYSNSIYTRSFLDLFKLNRALHYIVDACIQYEGLPEGPFASSFRDVFSDLVDLATTSKPVVIGFSILDIQRSFSLALINSLRRSYGGLLVVGGPDTTRFPDEYLKLSPAIDIVFNGEAEESFPALVEMVLNGNTNYRLIPGIHYRDDCGEIRHTQSQLIDYNYQRPPDFTGLPLSKYLTPAFPIQISRGCYWEKCSFCVHYDTYGQYHKRSVDLVVNDLEHLVAEYGAKYFHFTDDCISISLAHKLANEILARNIDIRWLSYFRIEGGLSKDLLAKLYAAGGRVLELGLESASSRVLELMNKEISIDTARRLIDDAAEVGFLLKLFMFHGYPGETAEDLDKTIQFTLPRILDKKIRAFFPLRNRFELLKGSDVYDECLSGTNENIEKVWVPSGRFGIRAEYKLTGDEGSTETLINEFVLKVKAHMDEHNVYNADDENVMLDLITLEYSSQNSAWKCR